MYKSRSVVDEVEGPHIRPLRVCLVIGQLGLGGTEKQLVLLADGLKQRRVDVTVVVLTGEGPREAALRAAGVPVVYLRMTHPNPWLGLLHLLAAPSRLTVYLRRSRPDVVHAFLFHSYVLAAPAGRLARVPAIIAGRRSLDDFKRGRPLMLAAERVATWMTDLLVANAQAVADRVRITEGVRPDKLVVIYNGIPPSAFVAAEPAEVDTVLPVLLCVANLKGYKGQLHLLDATALLRHRGLPCTVVLVGEGPERAALHRRATDLCIDVRLLGARTDVDQLLARADVVVLPSLTEGMSNAVMEGMAAGHPVVATAVGGTPELLAEGRGVLVSPGDSAGLADAIAGVLLDPEHAAAMGRAARDWTWAHLHVDAMVQQHLALYDDLLERRCAA